MGQTASDSPGVLTQPPLIYIAALILGLILERLVSLLDLPLWPLLLLPAVLVVMRRTAIEREEAYLQRKFDQAYLTYKASTRRWI